LVEKGVTVVEIVAGHEMVKRNDVSVKMDARVVEEARIAAAFKKMSLAEYLSESLRSIVARDIEEGYKRRAGAHPETRRGKKGHGETEAR
jgi:hypothetical protein